MKNKKGRGSMKQRLSKEEGDVLAENGIEIKIIGKIRTAYPNIGELIEWVIRESGMGYQHDYNPMTKQHSLLLYNESSEFFFNDVKAEELIDALFEMVIKIKESNEVSK